MSWIAPAVVTALAVALLIAVPLYGERIARRAKQLRWFRLVVVGLGLTGAGVLWATMGTPRDETTYLSLLAFIGSGYVCYFAALFLLADIVSMVARRVVFKRPKAADGPVAWFDLVGLVVPLMALLSVWW